MTKSIFKIVKGALIASVIATPDIALAQSNTIGDRLQSIGQELWGPLFLLIACASFAVGLYLLWTGLLKLSRQNETREGLWRSGFAHILAAALLISLPDAAGIGLRTVFSQSTAASALSGVGLDFESGTGSNPMSSIAGNAASAAAPQNCMGQDAPATCMAKNIASNAIPMAVWTLFGITFLVGLITFSAAIIDITKSQGQQGLPKGWGVKIVTSVLLMNAATLFTFVSNTVLSSTDSPITAQGLNAGSSLLQYPSDSSIQIIQKYAEMIGYCFTILTFFGVWAFVRGIFLVKATAEGRSQQGSYGMGFVFIVAGILLANAKYSSCVILTTMGGSQMAQGFCS
jgi:hypothetical protein